MSSSLFSDIFRDNMLVNPSGLAGHAMPMDLNIEHLIGYLKVTISLFNGLLTLKYDQQQLFVAKGMYANWDRLGNISAAINHLQSIKKQVFESMQTSYHGSTHTKADTSNLVWRIANKAQELHLQREIVGRANSSHTKATPDLRALGRQKFRSSSMATFNKKIEEYKQGLPVSHEVDEISTANFDVASLHETLVAQDDLNW
jgi:hypothetical protein